MKTTIPSNYSNELKEFCSKFSTRYGHTIHLIDPKRRNRTLCGLWSHSAISCEQIAKKVHLCENCIWTIGYKTNPELQEAVILWNKFKKMQSFLLQVFFDDNK